MTDESDETAPAPPVAKRKPAPRGRKAVIGKLWKAAQTQLEAHEAHLAELPAGTAASEVDAKTLATLARNRAFWRQTLIPLIRRTAQSLAQWLGPAFGDALTFEPDLDAIEALADERESLWRRVSAASFLDEDEKREAVGYGRREVSS